MFDYFEYKRYKFSLIQYYRIWANRIKYLVERCVDITPIFDMPDFSDEKEFFWNEHKGY